MRLLLLLVTFSLGFSWSNLWLDVPAWPSPSLASPVSQGFHSWCTLSFSVDWWPSWMSSLSSRSPMMFRLELNSGIRKEGWWLPVLKFMLSIHFPPHSSSRIEEWARLAEQWGIEFYLWFSSLIKGHGGRWVLYMVLGYIYTCIGMDFLSLSHLSHILPSWILSRQLLIAFA